MTRVTKFDSGSYVHCIKRGAFGREIFRDASDYSRFIRLLYLCNDVYLDPHFNRIESTLAMFERPAHWPAREPIVDIISFVAMPNHFHLLLRERSAGGIALFIKRISLSMTKAYNSKYKNQGSIFQGKYKPVPVESVEHLIYLIYYINVKNVCELYPSGGLKGAVHDFDNAYEWIQTYMYSTNKVFTQDILSPIISREAIDSISRGQFEDPEFAIGHDKERFKKHGLAAIKLSHVAKNNAKSEISDTRRAYLKYYQDHDV